MGWLDNLLGLNDPSQAAAMGLGANLLSAGGPSRMPVSTGQAIGQSLMGARELGAQTQNDILRRQLIQATIADYLSQAQQRQSQAQKLQQEQELQARIESLARGSFTPGVSNWQPGQGAGMPSPENIGTSLPPTFDRNAFMSGLSSIAPLKAMELMQKSKPVEVAAGASLWDPNENRAIFTAPNKDPSAPAGIQEYNLAVSQGYKGTFQQWLLDLAKAKATSVTVGLQSPYAATDANGNPIVLQPANRPGAPASILTNPNTGEPVRPYAPPTKVDVVAQRAYNSNLASIAAIDRAIKDAQDNPSAFGLQNYFGEDINQRLDPSGVKARANVSNVGSLKRHERTGAAMSMAEAPILRPFIPSPTDTADAIVTKLNALKAELVNTNASIMPDAQPQTGAAPTQSNDGWSVKRVK